MKKIVYILLLLSVCLIPKTTFATTKVNVSNDTELRSALESTTENEIILTDDVEVTYDQSLEDEENYLMVKEGKHILDLNNHSIKTESIAQSDYGLITVIGGSLEIKGNGQVTARNVVLSVMSGTLTINGGTYISGNENYADVVIMTYSGTIIVNKGNFTGNTYAEGPESNGNGGMPSQGTSLPILSSNKKSNIQTNRTKASEKLGAPLDTNPNITINEGTFNSTTYVSNTNLTINGGTFKGENAVEVSGNNGSLKVNNGNFNGDDIGLLVNTTSGDPTVALNGGTYSCTDCGDQTITFGAITVGPFTQQNDGTQLLQNILGNNANIDDSTMTEETTVYNNESVYFYHSNNLIKVTTPAAPKEDKEDKTKERQTEEIENPETSDNILLSVIVLISSLSVILVGTKELNNN